ncbi:MULTISPECIES: hypothetical protein [unclassified Streptomyces]|uniref:hypothetical protein n=1 Tax=unclassified Streptomyces TaxID=2593676 RepID=UPI003D761E85
MDAARAEIVLLEGTAARLAAGQRKWAAWWRFVETWAGLTVAILSALAGVSILEEQRNQLMAGVFALTASGLSATLGFVQPSGRARKADLLALRCSEFERRARHVRLITLPDSDRAEAFALVGDLTQRWEAICWDDVNDRLEQGPDA